MTREECVTLAQYVAELCPQQKMGKATGLIWHDVLGNLEFAECRRAAAAIAARQPFIAPSEIIAEIAARRSVHKPYSNACRGGDHGDCRVSWCGCACHPSAIAALASSPPAALPPGVRAIGRRPDA